MKIYKASAWVAVTMVQLLYAATSYAGDIAGSADHPMISRYAGSTIVKYSSQKYTDYRLLNKKISNPPEYGGAIDDTNSIGLEGKLTKISYELAAGRSTPEVFRNYETELQKAGFTSLFTCDNQACGGRAFNLTVVPYQAGFGGNYDDQRYLAAKLERAEGDVYVALYVVRNYSAGGPTQNRIYTQLNVVETVPMQTGMVEVDADAMSREIAESGKIALYGIYFDSGKSDIKPESAKTLEEIAKLLNKDPALKIVIVGHTDNVGKLEYNMDLSRRRAAAVEQELIRKYSIAADRLKSWGVGYLSPVSTNRSEEGRAKNRRVELVEQ